MQNAHCMQLQMVALLSAFSMRVSQLHSFSDVGISYLDGRRWFFSWTVQKKTFNTVYSKAETILLEIKWGIMRVLTMIICILMPLMHKDTKCWDNLSDSNMFRALRVYLSWIWGNYQQQDPMTKIQGDTHFLSQHIISTKSLPLH